MAFLNWRAKKRLSFLFLFLAFFVFLVVFVVYFSKSEPTCFDKEKNQNEEDIDCGGPCISCVVNPKDIIVLWTRVFKTSEGVYEVASLIKNPNLFYGIPVLKYTFKVYDSANILVSIKEGQTFINPQDEFLIFFTGVETGKREVAKAFVEVEPLSDWKYVAEKMPSLVVSDKNFSNSPFPVMRVRLFNESLFSVENIFATIVLYDDEENVTAISSTVVDFIQGRANRDIVFTWQTPFEKEPVSSKIFTRINLID